MPPDKILSFFEIKNPAIISQIYAYDQRDFSFLIGKVQPNLVMDIAYTMIHIVCQFLIGKVQQLYFQHSPFSLYSFSAFFKANYWKTPSVRSGRALMDGKFPVREDSLEKRRLKNGAELRNLPRGV